MTNLQTVSDLVGKDQVKRAEKKLNRDAAKVYGKAAVQAFGFGFVAATIGGLIGYAFEH